MAVKQGEEGWPPLVPHSGALPCPPAKLTPWGFHWCAAASFQALHPRSCLASQAPVARSLCDLPWWPSAPLPLRPEDCFTLSSICPDPFHSLWRLPTPRLQPPESSVPLCADLPGLIRLLTSCSSPTTLPGSLLMALFLLSTCLSRYVSSVGWFFPHPLRKI